MSQITDIYAREILDSRGNPTIEVDVQLIWRNNLRLQRAMGPPPDRICNVFPLGRMDDKIIRLVYGDFKRLFLESGFLPWYVYAVLGPARLIQRQGA